MTCIINVAFGKGYERGQLRLSRSLGMDAPKLITWQSWPPWEGSKDTPYNVKAAAFASAIAQGYTRILWLDASVIVSGSLDPIFDKITAEGVYLPSSGYNCAQTCNDRILDYFQVTRDQAEAIPDGSTGCFGVDTNHPTGQAFARMFITAAKDGQFSGSRLHDNQSTDPRFLFHRQDQSAAALIAHHLSVKTSDLGDLCGYFGQKHSGRQVVHFKGIE